MKLIYAVALLAVGCAHQMPPYTGPTVTEAMWAPVWRACSDLARDPDDFDAGTRVRTEIIAAMNRESDLLGRGESAAGEAVVSSGHIPSGRTPIEDCAILRTFLAQQAARERYEIQAGQQSRENARADRGRLAAAAALQGLGNGLSPAGAPAARPINCTSMTSGNMTSTSCY